MHTCAPASMRAGTHALRRARADHLTRNVTNIVMNQKPGASGLGITRLPDPARTSFKQVFQACSRTCAHMRAGIQRHMRAGTPERMCMSMPERMCDAALGRRHTTSQLCGDATETSLTSLDTDFTINIYPVHARIRKSLGEMTRKLSDTASQ